VAFSPEPLIFIESWGSAPLHPRLCHYRPSAEEHPLL